MFRTEIKEEGVEVCMNSEDSTDSIFRKHPKLDFLSVLLEEGRITSQDNCLSIPHELIIEFSPLQLKTLGLPVFCPHMFSCRSTGTVLRDNYEIKPLFKNNTGKPLGRFDKQGAFIVLAGKRYTVPRVVYQTLELVAKINDVKQKEHKLANIKKLKEVIPFESLQNDASLAETNVVVANKFTLEMVDEKNCIMLPNFVEQDERDMVDILPKNHIKSYQEKFTQFNEVKDRTQVARNKFVVLSDDLMQVIKLVKESHSKSVTERRALYANPSAYFEKVMGEDYREELQELFVATPEYISARVRGLGVWEPKTHAFLPSQRSEWMPKDCVGIALDNEIVFMQPERIEQIAETMEKAVKEEKETIKIGEQAVKANQENIDCLRQVGDNIKKQQEKEVKEVEEKEKAIKLAPIVKDNIEGSTYFDSLPKRVAQEAFLPKLLKTKELFEHQHNGIRWLQTLWNSFRRGALLADDMGLGKTLQTLAFLAWLKELEQQERLEKKPILIVGPTGLLKNWQDEHRKHLVEPGLGRLVEGFGSALKRIKQQGIKNAVDHLTKADWVLTTYQSLAQNENIFRRVEWRVLVFDECQAIKNPAAFQTDMAKAMAADFSIGITGTPVENSLGDLWCISDTMSPGLLDTYKNFRDRYEKTSDRLQELADKLREDDPPPFLLRRMKEDHLKGLPDKQEFEREAQMPVTQANEYTKIINAAQAGEFKKAPLQAIQRMKTVSIAPDFSEGIDDAEFIASSAKMTELCKILDEIKARQEKVLIFLESRQVQNKLIPLLQRRYALASPPPLINGAMTGVARKAKVDNFQALPAGFAIMIISPKAGGTGLTITAANNVIHLERWWNPAVEDQCSARVHRIGQHKNVNVYLPMAVHPKFETFDQVLHDLLSDKRELSRQVIVPTHFNAQDRKKLFEKTTDCPYDDKEDEFYHSQAWRELRYRVLNKYGNRCQKCGATKADGAVIQVDHIKPRSKYPELELDFDNLQVLCQDCNMGKSNKYEDDHRDLVLNKYGNRCQKCGATKADGAVIQVYHIKPCSKCLDRELDCDNLQVLCRDCNVDKSN